ncbi:MAG: TonB-dependent receptor plug domain-containing protein, partial [Tannerella sp.]|nr:TonB-dependent receptor plug domain-containing protein [Tannerella sp.]
MQQVLMEIERISEFYFSYSTRQIDADRKVNINLKNRTATEVLDELFDGSGVKYTIDDKHIILFKTDDNVALSQHDRRVTGTVKDTQGEAIAGANVAEKGTTNGIVTDADGNFSLDVADNAVLKVSYIGYITQEINALSSLAGMGGKPLIITLLEDTRALEEVVVIGYGVQKKAHLTGAVTAVKADEIKSVPAGNLTNALSGRLSGVNIRQTSGGRPGNSSKMNVRAIGTWNSSDPLYVIDGVVRDARAFDMLNSSEVENISILKDAAAATVYGSRAANGVILVTTKKGQEGKAQVTYSGSVSLGEMAIAPK